MYLTKTVRQVDLFHNDLILIPIHLGAHWAVVFVSPHENVIEYYDSLLNDGEQCFTHKVILCSH